MAHKSNTLARQRVAVGVLLTLALLSGPAAAQSGRPPTQAASPASEAHPTVVSLANGDRVSGLLTPSDASALHLKSDALGDVAVPWKAVAAIQFGDAVAISLTDGRRVAGAATFTPEGTLVLTNAAGETAADVTAIARLAWADQPVPPVPIPTWRDHWNVSAGTQLYASRGNSGATTFGGNFSITRQGEHDRLGLYGNRRLSNAFNGVSFSQVSDNAAAGARFDRDLSNRLVGFVSTDFQRDRFQRVVRLWVSGGVAWRVVNGTTRSFTVPIGVSFGYDRQVAPASGTGTPLVGGQIEFSRSYNMLQLGDSLQLRLGSPRVVISQDLTIYAQLGSASVSAAAAAGSDASNRRPISGNVRADFSSAVTVQLSSWLGWQVGVQDSYQRQPYRGVKPNDLTISSGFTFVVGRSGTSAYGGASSILRR